MELEKICSVYNASIKEISALAEKFPPFAGYNHERVVEEATEVYGDREKVKKAILSSAPFAGLNHERVLRQKSKIGRIIELTKEKVVDKILNMPINAGYSYKRDLARIDIARQLVKENYEISEEDKKHMIMQYAISPYIPGTRLRISKGKDGFKEPPLLTYMRKRLTKNST